MGCLGKFDPISDQKDFSYIYKNAQKWHCDVAVIYFLESSCYKFSAVASKKIGKAIKRNRAKRVLRAAFLSTSSELKSGSYILIAKTAIDEKKSQDVQKMLQWSFKRLGCFV